MKNNFFVKDSKIPTFIVTYIGLKVDYLEIFITFFIRDYDTYIKFKFRNLIRNNDNNCFRKKN